MAIPIRFEEHKKRIYERLILMKGERKAKEFIDFYSDRYDKYSKKFLDPRLSIKLYDDWHKVQKAGTIAYGIVGLGGAGKSTLMHNILYFLDKKYSYKESTTKIKPFVEVLKSYPLEDSMRSAGLDEPDGGHHFSSKEGVGFRHIVGKWRKQGLFIGMCATDLGDIPPYLFKKLNVLIFIPKWGVAHVFRDMPRKNQFILQEIKERYQRGKGYAIFFEYAKKNLPGYKRINTFSDCPMYIDYPKQYDKRKSKDYAKDMDNLIGLLDKKEITNTEPTRKELTAKVYRAKIKESTWRLYSQGKNITEITELLGEPRSTIGDYITEFRMKKKSKESEIFPAVRDIDKDKNKNSFEALAEQKKNPTSNNSINTALEGV